MYKGWYDQKVSFLHHTMGKLDTFNTPDVQSRPLEGIFHHAHIVGLPSQVAKVPDPWLRSRSPEEAKVWVKYEFGVDWSHYSP